ncbi:hypothetical protein J2Y55_003070 [Bosea sp. BE125]|uniref:hypothetical protein n=1 Tax=Bosea sp. BE125 TaxID=2817909 RepID=UPI0028653E23|nr:hypothetical protein [Bosea sp. BE125]MDR6872054.1 hypothetical protein [Bosea sp. BE125]
MIWRLALISFVLSAPAAAQEQSAYRVGMKIAQGRGYDNADCYARVFARHAVAVERESGRRGWHAASTPEYNAEQRSRCGIDRLQARTPRRQAQADGAGSIPYRIGLGLAAHRDIYGASGRCYARIFETFASRVPSPDRNIRYGVFGAAEQGFARELQRSCGLSY